VMAFCLLSGKKPFRGATEAEVTQAVQHGNPPMEGEVWEGVWQRAKEFVLRLLSPRPRDRPSAAEALRDPWITAAGFAPASRSPQISVSEEVLQSVRHFACESPANRAAAALLAYAEPAQAGADVELAEEQFRALDADGNGTLSLAELARPMHDALGVSDEECKRIFDGIDMVNDHEIERSEFLTAVRGVRLVHSEKAIRRAFDLCDRDQDGTISPAELISVLGPCFCGEPATRIFSEWDSSGKKAISFDQFVAVLGRLRDSGPSPVSGGAGALSEAEPLQAC